MSCQRCGWPRAYHDEDDDHEQKKSTVFTVAAAAAAAAVRVAVLRTRASVRATHVARRLDAAHAGVVVAVNAAVAVAVRLGAVSTGRGVSNGGDKGGARRTGRAQCGETAATARAAQARAECQRCGTLRRRSPRAPGRPPGLPPSAHAWGAGRAGTHRRGRRSCAPRATSAHKTSGGGGAHVLLKSWSTIKLGKKPCLMGAHGSQPSPCGPGQKS